MALLKSLVYISIGTTFLISAKLEELFQNISKELLHRTDINDGDDLMAPPPQTILSPIISTQYGDIQGEEVPKNLKSAQKLYQPVYAFRGVPFAAPPVGPLRFKPPQAPVSWEGTVVETVENGNICIQSAGGSEDCLYLNVYVPADLYKNKSGKPIAVMVYIYGGGFVNGSAYDGTALASVNNVIVVSMNYRLGMLGFFTSNALANEEGRGTGNYGLLDQQFALKWVKENISSFGGDSENITIFGESAGAFSVLTHLVAPGSKGLFTAAIAQSPSSDTEVYYQSLDDGVKYYDWVSSNLLGCEDSNDLDCLRGITDARKFVYDTDSGFTNPPTWSSPFYPVMPDGFTIDGVNLNGSPLTEVDAGNFDPSITLMFGFNRNEGGPFNLMTPKCVPGVSAIPQGDDTLKMLHYATVGENDSNDVKEKVQSIIDNHYPKETYSSIYERRSADEGKFYAFEQSKEIIRDAAFHCAGKRFANAYQKHGGRAFFYSFEFNVFPIFSQNVNVNKYYDVGGPLIVSQMDSFHYAEVPFIFKQFSDDWLLPLDVNFFMKKWVRSENDTFHKLSDILTCLWSSFSKCHADTENPFCSPESREANCPGVNFGIYPDFNSMWQTWDSEKLNYMTIKNPYQGQVWHKAAPVFEFASFRQNNQYPDSAVPSIDKCDVFDEVEFKFLNPSKYVSPYISRDANNDNHQSPLKKSNENEKQDGNGAPFGFFDNFGKGLASAVFKRTGGNKRSLNDFEI